jgi:hypothetical protein
MGIGLEREAERLGRFLPMLQVQFGYQKMPANQSFSNSRT